MSEEPEPIFFMIGEKQYQNLDGYLADESGDLVLFQKKKIPIQIDPDPTISAIHAIKDGEGKRIYTIRTKSKEETFADVVEAMIDMHKSDGRFHKLHGYTPMEKARTNPNSFENAHETLDMGDKQFGTQKSYEKFLVVGENAGLIKGRKAVVKPKVVRTVKGKKLAKEKKEFGRIEPYQEKNKKGELITKQPDKYIVKWQKKRLKQKGDKYTNTLWKALQWLDLSTEEIVHPVDDQGHLVAPEDRKDWLTKRMATPTFKARDGKKYKFGEIDLTIPDDPKFSGLVFDRKIPTHDYQGKKIASRAKTFGINPLTREYEEGSQGARVPVISVLKGFLDSNDWSIGDNLGHSMWALKVPKGHHAKIYMKAQQIIDMFQHLRDGAYGDDKSKNARAMKPSDYKFKTLEWHKIEGDDEYKEWETNQADWKDALDYWIIGLQLGWREQEAFTAVAMPVDKESNKSGVYINQEDDLFIVRIYTRKTAHVGRKIQGGFILREDTGQFARDIIKTRMDQVSKGIGIDKTISGLSTEDNGKPNNAHSLIGVDGKYTQVGTMGFPADARFSTAKKHQYDKDGKTIPQVRPKRNAREKLRAILTHNYDLVGLTESFWQNHAGHAVRHTFAQLWMKKSGGNLAFVKDWGHWGGIKVLEDHYAEPSDPEKLQNAKNYGGLRLDIIAKQEAKIAQQRQKEKDILAETFKNLYGKESTQPDTPADSLPDSNDPDDMPDPDADVGDQTE